MLLGTALFTLYPVVIESLVAKLPVQCNQNSDKATAYLKALIPICIIVGK